jgi:uncharacterized membrane protein
MANTGEWIKMFHIFFVVLGFSGMVAFPLMMRAAAGASELAVARTCLRYAGVFDALSGIGFLGAGLIGLGLAIYQEWDFAENTWLTASITLLVIALVGATIVQQPALFKLNRLAREARARGARRIERGAEQAPAADIERHPLADAAGDLLHDGGEAGGGLLGHR